MPPAACAAAPSYRRRQPEKEVLYQLIQRHLETFAAQAEEEDGGGLPSVVKRELFATASGSGWIEATRRQP
jgi:hypothetical protein